MFSYSMVAKEIEQVFEQTTFAKTAAYEALTLAQKGNDEMCSYKMRDLQAFVKNTQTRIKELEAKIEFLKQHP